jgi:hypothetical protein
MRYLFLSLFIGVFNHCFSQSHILSGKIINSKLEPIAFASIQVKENKIGTVTNEDGTYFLELDQGKYDLIITILGYKTQTITVIMRNENFQQNIILESSDAESLTEVILKGKNRDRAVEYIRNVIQHKEVIESAAGAYSCKVYIKAVQEDPKAFKKNKKTVLSDSMLKVNQVIGGLNGMAMAEIILNLDRGAGKKTKEERTGVTKKGSIENLFYLSTTEGDFNFYNNIINIPSISQTTFLSPLSYSGLLAYRFKTVKIITVNGRKLYSISVIPRQLSNATVEGEITVMDSCWVVLYTKFNLPKYHLANYDFFEVEQQYNYINNTAWLITRQQFKYSASSGKKKSSGETIVSFNNYELNKRFANKYFGSEVSSATQQAYERDSTFWQSNRTEPLTQREVQFIHYKDSIYQAIHSKVYLDSMDKVINKITLKKVFITGQNFNNHEKSRSWYIPSLPSIYNPVQFGGARLQLSFMYSKTFNSRKNIFYYNDISYGVRNKDINGNIRLNRMYNPFNRGFYAIRIQKNFEFIFSGDAWINMIKRSNLYLNQTVGAGHGIELLNGFYFYSDFDVAFRRSLSDYKTSNRFDSLGVGILENNRAPAFDSYNAVYGTFRLSYTPRQRYIREPKEKVVLGSYWPTVYISMKKGIPLIFNSNVNFDYLQFGLEQSIKLRTLGTSYYSIKTGSYLNTKKLQLVDYKFQRRGDPILFSNPAEAFQSLDSTFPLFRRFYEGHYLHEFNGALLNKIPIFNKLRLREIAGGGFLLAPERNNLRYGELYAGVERVFKYPFNQLGKFKLGAYISAAVANQFHNPVQFKLGITTWDKKNGKWL